MKTDREKAFEIYERIGFDTEAGFANLVLIAECIKLGNPIPALAEHTFVKAVERMKAVQSDATGKPVEHSRATRLVVELGVVRASGAPRKFVSRHAVLLLVQAYGEAISETCLAKSLVSTYGIKLSNARLHIKSAKAGLEEASEWFRSLAKENGLEGGLLVRSRRVQTNDSMAN